jgi:hypothetical protein
MSSTNGSLTGYLRERKHGVLENVGDAGRVERRGAKGGSEHLVLVVVDERQ